MKHNNNYNPTFKGNQIEAIYTTSIEPTQRHNPLTEALPPPFDNQILTRRLMQEPVYYEAERNLPAIHRLEATQRLFDYIDPMTAHLNLARKLSAVIRNTYSYLLKFIYWP